MSGIEVVGVILGVVPLLISGMEHYADGVSTLGRYRRYKLELRTLINILETEKAKLLNTCDKLLVGLASPCKIEAMIEDPFGEIWRDEEIQKKIQLRLWRSFRVFEETVKDVHAAIKEMVSRLGLQPDGKVKWVEGNSLLRELKRATFSLKKASYNDLLTRIKDGIASLDTLTAQSVELEPKRKIRSQGRLLTLLREISKSLYHALKDGLTCNKAHYVTLELAARSAEFMPHDEDDHITKELSFSVAISDHTDVNSEHFSAGNLQFRDEFIIRETTERKLPVPEPLLPDPSASKKKREKSVRFLWQVTTTADSKITTTSACPPTPELSTALVHSVAGLLIGTTVSNPGKHNLPMDLCRTVHKARESQAQSCYGYLVDDEWIKRRVYGVYPTAEARHGDKYPAVSLRQALEGSAHGLPPLTYRDRLYLAVIISFSMLQLQHTPWLPGILTSQDIWFIRRENSPLYERAFVVQKIPGDSRSVAMLPMKSMSATYDPTMLSLGVLLIELIIGKPLHQADSSGKLEAGALADYITAQKLLSEVDQWGGINYGSAVRRCLNYHARRRHVGLEDEEVRQDVYSSVVAILEQNLRDVEA